MSCLLKFFANDESFSMYLLFGCIPEQNFIIKVIKNHQQ